MSEGAAQGRPRRLPSTWRTLCLVAAAVVAVLALAPPLGSPFTHLVERRLVGRRTKKPQMHTTASVPTGMAKVSAWVLARPAIIGCLLRAQMTGSLLRAQMT